MYPEDLPLASQFLSEARTGFQDGGMVGSYLEPYEPTLRERVQYRISDFLINHGMDPYVANRRARNVVGDPDLDFSAPGAMGLADLTPVGSIFGLPEAWRTVRRGLNTGDALTTGAGALEGILSLADTIPLVGGIVARAANPLVRFGATIPNQPAIIRPDDVYRGEGTPRITVRQTDQPFVVRGTQQDQIDDMIQSGLVRPNRDGWKGSSQLYFGESPTALPTSILGRPSETRFVMVGDSDKLAGTEGPIPIDQLRHVWVVRDGETVDVLPDILRANRDFGSTGQ